MGGCYERGGRNSMRADLGLKSPALDLICSGLTEHRSVVPRILSLPGLYGKLRRADNERTCLL